MSAAALQRASVPLLLLGLIDREPTHGYGLTQALKERGFAPLTGAQLYPALAKLEEAGRVSADWEPQASGPARKVYSMTAAGHAELRRLTEEWEAFGAAVASVLGVGAGADALGADAGADADAGTKQAAARVGAAKA